MKIKIGMTQSQHECKTDRDAHLQQIIANTQSNDQIEPRLSSEKEQHYQNEVIRCLKEVGRFSSHIGTIIFKMKCYY